MEGGEDAIQSDGGDDGIPNIDMRPPRSRGVIRRPLINNAAISNQDRQFLCPFLYEKWDGMRVHAE
eukprot:3400673-Pyramimonas_sp.AAC.1